MFHEVGEVQLVALRAGERARAGVGADHDLARAGDDRHDRHHHVRPDDAGDEVDLVLLQHLLGDLHADVGLELVVAVEHLDRQAADLAAEVLDGELDRLLHVLADHALRAGHRADEADLDLLLLRCRRHRESDARRQCSGENGFDHCVLLRRSNSNRNLGLGSLEDDPPLCKQSPTAMN